MSTALSFALIHTAGGGDIWHNCQRLAAVLQAGDDLVLIDTTPDTGAPRTLAQFTREGGWPHGIVPRVIALPQAPDAAGIPALLKTHCAQPYALWLEGTDSVQAGGVAQLRQSLGRSPDLILANHGWHLGHASAALPCADADRWPEAVSSDAALARDLMPDARRLIGPMAGPDYDAAVAQAGSVHLVPAPVVLRPLPARMDDRFVTGIVDSVMALPRAARPEALRRALVRLSDALALVHPVQVLPVLETLHQMYRALPRGLRAAAAQQMPLVGAMSRGGPDAALPHLSLQIAAQDRARVQVLGTALETLRRNVDVALPGPDYLMDLYERTRRG